MRDILIGTTAGWLVGAAWWFGVALPRRRKYEEFYRNYDAEAIEEATKASFEEGEHYLEITHTCGYRIEGSSMSLQPKVGIKCLSDYQFIISCISTIAL